MTRGPLESDTCRDYVLPKLNAAGWSADRIYEQYTITDGRIEFFAAFGGPVRGLGGAPAGGGDAPGADLRRMKLH